MLLREWRLSSGRVCLGRGGVCVVFSISIKKEIPLGGVTQKVGYLGEWGLRRGCPGASKCIWQVRFKTKFDQFNSGVNSDFSVNFGFNPEFDVNLTQCALYLQESPLSTPNR